MLGGRSWVKVFLENLAMEKKAKKGGSASSLNEVRYIIMYFKSYVFY